MLLHILWGVVFLTLAVCWIAIFIPRKSDRLISFFAWLSGMNVLLAIILIISTIITRGYLT